MKLATTPEEMEQMKQWVQQWRIAEPMLLEQKMLELQAMTDEQLLFFIDAVMGIAEGAEISPERWNYSGLIEQQRIFHRLPALQPDDEFDF